MAMEVYVAPPEGSGQSLTREQALAALVKQGLQVVQVLEQPASGSGRAHWILSFAGTDVRLDFQDAGGALVFATLEQSMFDDSNVPDRICEALESVGWEVDNENIG
jgi:hypothetical protein